MGKGKFIYVLGDDRIVVKDSAFPFDPTKDVAFPISKFSTDDLLKLKAQLATEIENRMDLDEVTEANLTKLKQTISEADSKVVATILRQTLDRIELVNADLKRANTRKQLLEDELSHRMANDGVSTMNFAGVLSVTYKAESVFSVGEAGWDTVYNGIYAKAKELEQSGQSILEAFTILQKRLTSTALREMLQNNEALPAGIEVTQINKLSTRRSK